MSTSSGILMRGDFRKRDGSTLKAPGIASGPSVPASSSKSNRSSTATLLVDFSLSCEHRRTDAAQPKPADHSQQSQPPPAGVEADRNSNRDGERGRKMFDPAHCNIQFIREKIAEPHIEA